MVARKLADRLGKKYARTAVVDNKPGAAGRLAVNALKAAPPDGSALLVTPGSVVAMYPHIYPQLSYDVFADLEPVAVVASTEFCLAVGPAVPKSVVSLNDFTQWCKAHSEQANCGNAGAGSFPHFMAMLLNREVGLALNHVPFRGGSAAMLALAGGQVSAVLATEGSAIALEQAGKIRVLVTSATQKSAFFPKAASFSALGFRNLVQREWFGVFARAGTSAALIGVVADEVRQMLAEVDVREAWNRLGLLASASTPAELQIVLRQDYDFWRPIIKQSGFTPDA